jgi:hypothetical protein
MVGQPGEGGAAQICPRYFVIRLFIKLGSQGLTTQVQPERQPLGTRARGYVENCPGIGI